MAKGNNKDAMLKPQARQFDLRKCKFALPNAERERGREAEINLVNLARENNFPFSF